MSAQITICCLLLMFGASCSDSSPKSSAPEPEEDAVVEPPPGIWGAHRIIDIHAHIGFFRNFDLGMPTLLDNVDRYGVQMALISNIDGANLPGTTNNLDEIETNRATADSVLKYRHLFRGLLWTRPNQSVATGDFEQFLTAPEYAEVFVGMKFHAGMNQFSADSEILDPYLELCAEYNLDLLVKSPV